MLNIEEFLKRLEALMENHQLNAAAFAEKIGVQRSSVSHILSRRNKPSLDFILKIQAEFAEADFDWLLLGSKKTTSPTPDFQSTEQPKTGLIEIPKSTAQTPNSTDSISDYLESDIIQIIQIHKDGTFRVLLPKS